MSVWIKAEHYPLTRIVNCTFLRDGRGYSLTYVLIAMDERSKGQDYNPSWKHVELARYKLAFASYKYIYHKAVARDASPHCVGTANWASNLRPPACRGKDAIVINSVCSWGLVEVMTECSSPLLALLRTTYPSCTKELLATGNRFESKKFVHTIHPQGYPHDRESEIIQASDLLTRVSHN